MRRAPDPVTAAVAALAVYRLTLLVTADKLTEKPRDRLVLWANERAHGPRPVTSSPEWWESAAASRPHPLTYLLDCPWCASPYVALPVVAAAVLRPPGRVWWLACGVAAASAVAGALGSRVHP
jgi:hypothetical protein